MFRGCRKKQFLETCVTSILPFFVLFVSATLISYASGAQQFPCNYADTVNITEGLRLKDGSYSYGDLIIPANLIAEYNFKVIDGIEYRAPQHIRGCVCLLKPCISFCCPADLHFDPVHQNCTRPTAAAHLTTPQATHIEVTSMNSSGQVIHVENIQQNFVIRTEFGCRNKFVDKKHEEFWKWDLFENGSLSRDGKIWSTDEYCFTPVEHKQVWSLTPLNCERFQRGYRVWIYAICTILAIITNIFIFSLLASIREARKTHYGQLIIYYLLSTIVGYSALVYLALKNPMNLSHAACRNIGFLAYFCIMLSFVLLAICSYDFWKKFQLKSIRNWVRKLCYLIVVILVIGLRFLVSFAQDSNLPKNFKPGMGEEYCWFDVRLWGILIYYYAPIIVLLLFSLVCCYNAYSAMWELPEDTINIEGIDAQTMKTHFYAFLIYLIAAFSVWIREMIVFIMARMREHFFIIDFWSGIFILGLAITGFICLLGKNRHVRSWWAINVESSQTDLSIINAKVYKFDERGILKERDAERSDRVTSL